VRAEILCPQTVALAKAWEDDFTLRRGSRGNGETQADKGESLERFIGDGAEAAVGALMVWAVSGAVSIGGAHGAGGSSSHSYGGGGSVTRSAGGIGI